MSLLPVNERKMASQEEINKAPKKTRAPHWTKPEKMVLLQLIAENVNLYMGKKGLDENTRNSDTSPNIAHIMLSPPQQLSGI